MKLKTDVVSGTERKIEETDGGEFIVIPMNPEEKNLYAGWIKDPCWQIFCEIV